MGCSSQTLGQTSPFLGHGFPLGGTRRTPRFNAASRPQPFPRCGARGCESHPPKKKPQNPTRNHQDRPQTHPPRGGSELKGALCAALPSPKSRLFIPTSARRRRRRKRPGSGGLNEGELFDIISQKCRRLPPPPSFPGAPCPPFHRGQKSPLEQGGGGGTVDKGAVCANPHPPPPKKNKIGGEKAFFGALSESGSAGKGAGGGFPAGEGNGSELGILCGGGGRGPGCLLSLKVSGSLWGVTLASPGCPQSQLFWEQIHPK